MSSKQRILVTGATGTQGGCVVRRLLGRDFEVRALTRHEEGVAAKALAKMGVDVVEGDLNDAKSLEPAFDGVDGVFSVQSFAEAGFDGEVQQGKNLADLAKRHEVSHFIQSSVASAPNQTGLPHFESKWEIECHLAELKLPTTIFRPVFFMQNWEYMRESIFHGSLQLPLDSGAKLQQINVEDLAAFVAMAFEDPDRWIGKSLDLAGDELNMRDTARTFSGITGIDVLYTQIPWEDFEKQTSPEMARMYRWFNDVGYDADIESLRQLYPRLSKLAAYLDVHGWGRGEPEYVGKSDRQPAKSRRDRRYGPMHSLETPDPRRKSREHLERGR